MLVLFSFTSSLLEVLISFSDDFFSGRCNIVVLATALRAGRTDVRIPVAGILLNLKHVEAGPGVLISRHFNAYGVYFPDVKWPERDGDHLLESSVEVETVWN